MPDSSDIDQALITTLGSDATLLSLCPNGVYWDVSPQGSTRWVRVALIQPRDEWVFGGRAIEDNVYQVNAVMLSSANGNIKAAAARIEALLDQQTLTVSGYTCMAMFRDEELPRIRQTERDAENPDLLWFHRGIYLRVQMTLT